MKKLDLALKCEFVLDNVCSLSVGEELGKCRHLHTFISTVDLCKYY